MRINQKILPQYAQLLAIDWIMETRTALWELEYGNFDNDYYNFVPVEPSILTKFQNDLNLLRCFTNNIPVSSSDQLKFVCFLILLLFC